MKMKKILVIAGVILIGIVVFSIFRNDKNTDIDNVYRYEYSLDYLDEKYTDEVSIHVNRYDIGTNQGEYYTGIIDTTLYRYIRDHYGLTEEKGETKFISFSMTEEYIEGLSADNKFISGKLIDPDTKKQIGHWIFDLDKDDFKEVILDEFKPIL